ncbi:uncharacterized protein LOC126815816 isoform X2 [Patella vulgata]|uniref:uncharacterized protein LOC126815816 isoform X2 n=1 Tax=Patella vulgata TaxID=6465 RepID=UPI0021808BDA|nr:uncharacterized protein LOC126815816 isoform X2 [Patella vulgata]
MQSVFSSLIFCVVDHDMQLGLPFKLLVAVLFISTISGQDFLREYCKKNVKATGFRYYRILGYCNLFVQCNTSNPQLETCASGTFFDDNACKHASSVQCPDDPCKSLTDGTRFSDNGNCFGYYECRQSKAYYEHCPVGDAFNVTDCVADTTCEHPGVTAAVTEAQPACPNLQVNLNDATSYISVDISGTHHVMNCPPGLVFIKTSCGCRWPDSTQTAYSNAPEHCNALFLFPFNGDFTESKKRVYMQPHGAVYVADDRAYFEDGGQILVPYLQNVELGSNFALGFTFNYTGNSLNTNDVSLLSNENPGVGFSYRAVFNPAAQEIRVFLLLTDSTVVSMVAHNVDPLLEHQIRVGKAGDISKLQIDNQQLVTERAVGGVAAVASPLILGNTSTADPFNGYIDDVTLFRCQPNQFYV